MFLACIVHYLCFLLLFALVFSPPLLTYNCPLLDFYNLSGNIKSLFLFTPF